MSNGIIAKLAIVQANLKAPKGQFNSFGKYKYRSCEDILEAAKPVCHGAGVAIVLTDEIVMCGDRYYIRATASLLDTESDGVVSNTAYAREEAEKKGMDGSQITGTASSYARKYALNGLLAIDDTKDADTDENHKQTADKPKRDGAAPIQTPCSVCGKLVPRDIAERSKEANDGVVYCSGTCRDKSAQEAS